MASGPPVERPEIHYEEVSVGEADGADRIGGSGAAATGSTDIANAANTANGANTANPANAADRTGATDSADSTDAADGAGTAEERVAAWRRLYARAGFRKALVLFALAVLWELYARLLGNPLVFPTLTATLAALGKGIANGELPSAVGYTLSLLLEGYAAGLAAAAVLTALAAATRIGADLLETLTAMLNPLPSIALLPLALIWFGLGSGSVIFVLIHAVLWSVALATLTGFRSVGPTLRMVGRNYGLSGLGYIIRLLVPAAFPSILTGLKVGWAFAWRTLIAAELVFGVSSGSGGLGWFVFEKKNQLRIPDVFAGLLTVILLGLLIENGVFRVIERHTVKRWGMQA